MKDDKRRKALKAIAIGAPAVWAKPMVNSVMLPAHGSMTHGSMSCPECVANPDDGGNCWIAMSAGIFTSISGYDNSGCSGQAIGQQTPSEDAFIISCGPDQDSESFSGCGDPFVIGGWYIYDCNL